MPLSIRASDSGRGGAVMVDAVDTPAAFRHPRWLTTPVIIGGSVAPVLVAGGLPLARWALRGSAAVGGAAPRPPQPGAPRRAPTAPARARRAHRRAGSPAP